MVSTPTGIYGSQGRADFTVDDVEHYFNYMGMLAVEGTYDRMEEMLSSGVILLAAQLTLCVCLEMSLLTMSVLAVRAGFTHTPPHCSGFMACSRCAASTSVSCPRNKPVQQTYSDLSAAPATPPCINSLKVCTVCAVVQPKVCSLVLVLLSWSNPPSTHPPTSSFSPP